MAMILWSIVIAYVCILNLVTWHAWALDKKYAIARTKRVPESTLLCLCAVGGWPMALISSLVFRHKNRKNTFMHKVYCVAGFQIAVSCLIWIAV